MVKLMVPLKFGGGVKVNDPSLFLVMVAPSTLGLMSVT
ncbi:hypothetical protein D515_03925 [Grimontia indica]|uniref:Uncharacterized protein n=1 Tax=Grimontia indica TaxID=1056512 RepID=R1IPV6_9GAMM|nr:hypothetical protein D515_03925 [Grimontia indica]